MKAGGQVYVERGKGKDEGEEKEEGIIGWGLEEGKREDEGGETGSEDRPGRGKRKD